MTDAELSRIEGVFRNPPSLGVLPELGLELCAELRALRAAPVPPVMVSQPLEVHPEPLPVAVDHHDAPEPAPTPDARPAKPKAKK